MSPPPTPLPSIPFSCARSLYVVHHPCRRRRLSVHHNVFVCSRASVTCAHTSSSFLPLVRPACFDDASLRATSISRAEKQENTTCARGAPRRRSQIERTRHHRGVLLSLVVVVHHQVICFFFRRCFGHVPVCVSGRVCLGALGYSGSHTKHVHRTVMPLPLLPRSTSAVRERASLSAWARLSSADGAWLSPSFSTHTHTHVSIYSCPRLLDARVHVLFRTCFLSYFFFDEAEGIVRTST